MKLFKYPNYNKDFLVRARDLSVKESQITKNFIRITKRISNHGIFILGHEVENFEKKICKFLNVKHVVAVNSGTSALYLALKCLKLKKSDEIITTPMSWLVSSTVIKFAGGTPVFADVDENYNLDPNSIKKLINKNTVGILPVHFYGKVAQIKKIKKIADDHNLYLIEDTAQAFGASSNGKKAGTFGDFGTFSFGPMKVFGSFGNAGAVVFKNKTYLNKMRSLRTCGTVNREVCNSEQLKFDVDPIQVAFIKENFNVYNKLKLKRLHIAKHYYKKLHDKFVCPEIKKEYDHTFYDFTILVENRKKLIEFMYKNGIEVKVRHPILINNQPVFKNSKNFKVPNAKYYVSRILSLPMHYNLKIKQVNYVCEKLLEFKKKTN